MVSRPLLAHWFSLCDLRLFVIKRMLSLSRLRLLWKLSTTGSFQSHLALCYKTDFTYYHYFPHLSNLLACWLMLAAIASQEATEVPRNHTLLQQ